ncbi:MAG TPA: hypothetical protein PLL76_18220 [Thermoanaerobaculia bacterium]|nr:hypothetical protein [Thermoanaerobaculia bacterium]
MEASSGTRLAGREAGGFRPDPYWQSDFDLEPSTRAVADADAATGRHDREPEAKAEPGPDGAGGSPVERLEDGVEVRFGDVGGRLATRTRNVPPRFSGSAVTSTAVPGAVKSHRIADDVLDRAVDELGANFGRDLAAAREEDVLAAPLSLDVDVDVGVSADRGDEVGRLEADARGVGDAGLEE